MKKRIATTGDTPPAGRGRSKRNRRPVPATPPNEAPLAVSRDEELDFLAECVEPTTSPERNTDPFKRDNEKADDPVEGSPAGRGKDFLADDEDDEGDNEFPRRRALQSMAAKAALAASENQQKEARLPAGLRPGGVGEQLHAELAKSSAAKGLAAAVKYDLNRLRYEFVNATVHDRSPEADAGRYRCLVNDRREDTRLPVLRACLAAAAGFDLTDELAAEAVRWGCRNYHDFVAFFAGRMPTAIVEQVTAMVAAARYRANVNPTASEDWALVKSTCDADTRARYRGFPTGFETFDRRTGGLSGLMMIAGRTGVGKSLLATNLLLGAMAQSRTLGGLVYTLELSKAQVLWRAVSHAAAVPYNLLTDGRLTPAQQHAADAAEARLCSEVFPRLKIVELTPHAGAEPLTQEGMLEDIRAFRDLSGVDDVVVVIDSLQKVPLAGPPQEREPNDVFQSRTQRELERRAAAALGEEEERLQLVIGLQRATRAPQRPRGWPVLVLSEVRKPDRDRRLGVDDVLGSTHHGYSMDAVLLLEPASGAGSDDDVVPSVLNVAKIGEGRRRGDIPLLFHHTLCRFEEAVGTTAAKEDTAPPKEANRFRGTKPPRVS